MPLLNYTTTVAASRTAHQITTMLAQAGAKQVLLDYGQLRDGGSEVTGLSFAIDTDIGMMRYRLPVNTDAVAVVLSRDPKVPRSLKTSVQAERVAWRILKDWVEAQLALIATTMVTLDEVFLPYMMMGEGTVYELFRKQRLAIGPGE